MDKALAGRSITTQLWRQRIGYGVSDFACNLIWQMISLYLLYFYTNVMHLNPKGIATMFLVTRVIDGVTDLLIGYAIDRTNTRWGKSRPYFLFGAIPFALFAVLAFSVPDISATGKLIYAYGTYIGLSFMYTVVNIPMASILPSLTADTNERTALSTTRKFFAFLGATVVSATSLKLVEYFGSDNEAYGFRIVMIIFGVIGAAMFFVTFFNVKERVKIDKEKVSLKQSLKSLSQNKPWLIFALNLLFMWSGFFIQTSALIYYYTYVVQSTYLTTAVATIMSIVPMLANFLVPFLAKRLGKRNLFVLSAGIQLAGLIAIWLAGANTMFILMGAVVSAAGYGMKESIYFSMQADPVDYGIWKSGVDTSGTLSSVNGFLGKCAQAIAGWLAATLLAWGMFDETAAAQSANALTSISAMYLFIPMVLLVLSMITMLFYNLDRQYPEIKAELDRRDGLSEVGE